jgi:hypothetical protein
MKAIKPAIPDIKEEKIISFAKDDSGFFRKVEKIVYRNRDTNEITKGKETILDGFYRPTLDDEYDEEMMYQDIDGSDQKLKLRLVEEA